MDKVRQMLEAGVSLPTAIKEALAPLTIAAFAKKYGRVAPNISNIINGKATPTEKDLEAIIAELGGTPDEWRLLLWENSKPVSASA